MRFSSWSRRSLVVAGALLALWAGCTEDEPVQVDETAPVLSFVYPDLGTGLKISPTSIQDSIEIVVQAVDANGIERVEFWCTFHSDTVSTQLGVDDTADPGNLYRFEWNTLAYPNGTTGYLWARAIDKLGNEGRTAQGVSILTINSSDKRPPTADFTISPATGNVSKIFAFDPSGTTDQLFGDEQIRVRWDFDYNPQIGPTWDIDTTEARANAIQYKQYAVAGVYEIALQAFNTYFPQGSAIVTRELTVLPEFGEPNDPAPTVMIPMGTYPLGVRKLAQGGQPAKFGENEMIDSVLYVTFTANIFIDQFEVTNHFYVDYLNSAMFDSSHIEIDPVSGEVTDIATGQALIKLDSELTRIFYVDEETGFVIDENARNLPVTGVTWYGAKAYCSFYGLRLPNEYEWEVAARLGRLITTGDEYVYPWSPETTIAGNYANYRDSGDPYEERNNLRAECPIGSYSDIDSLSGSWPHENAVGPVGTYDQAGNVSEWVNDWYVPNIYATLWARYDATGRWPTDPQSPKESESATGTRVVRGGSFFDSPGLLRVTKREARAPEIGMATVGFRACYTEFNP